MKRKIIMIALGVVMFISLLANYIAFMSSNNSKINGGHDPHFFAYGDEVSLKVDGCLLWKDEKQRSKNFRQYWKIRVNAIRGRSECMILDVWDHGGSIIIPEVEECKLTHMNFENKTATITYKDAVLTVNRDRAIWTTSDPQEKGGGELVGCWDDRINWYPL
jgi:hypothetical protein